MALAPAHRGYEYQDLLVAMRLIDVMLGTIVEIDVDEKLVPDDRFDDLTTVDETGFRERTQVKHTDNTDQALTLATFTNDARRLRLDHVISAAIADRDRPGSQAREISFRIIMRDIPPSDPRLCAALRPANPDPGPFVHGMRSVRMGFRADALWGESGGLVTESPDGNNPFFRVQIGEKAVERPDLDWVCERLVVELDAPAASLDLTNPDACRTIVAQTRPK